MAKDNVKIHSGCIVYRHDFHICCASTTESYGNITEILFSDVAWETTVGFPRSVVSPEGSAGRWGGGRREGVRWLKKRNLKYVITLNKHLIK